MKKVIIIGAGPAGLTAGYDLLSKSSDYDVTIVEESSVVGGLCARFENEENVLDAGGHMYISNNSAVKQFWYSVLPAQGVPSSDDLVLDRYCKIHNGGPDPEVSEDVLLSREKLTRIYKDNKFYESPVKFNKDAVKNFGFANSIKTGFSQIGNNVFKHKELSLEDYYINRFGKQLYNMFIEEYLEKIWGKEPSRINSEWGVVAERSLIAPVISTEKNNNRDYEKLPAPYATRYYYPKYGAYQLWETAADRFIEMGGSIHKNCKVTGITTGANKIISVRCSADGDEFVVGCDYLISSMPIRDLILGMDDVDGNVSLAAENLSYRGMVSVCVELTELNWKNDTEDYKTVDDIIPDSVLYISNPNVKVSRIQVYNNFSPYMIRNSKHYYLGLNYYCNEGDYYWSMGNRDWKKTVVNDLVKLGIIKSEESIVGYNKTKYNKAFPTYYDGYEGLDKIVKYLNKYENLFCVGRNGQHRFSSIDEVMKTSFEAVKNILGNVTTKDNIWKANEKNENEDKLYNSALLSGEGEYKGNYVPLQKKIDFDNNEENKDYVPPRRMRRPMMTPIKKADPNKLSEPIVLNDSVVIAARPEKSIPISEPDEEMVQSVPAAPRFDGELEENITFETVNEDSSVNNTAFEEKVEAAVNAPVEDNPVNEEPQIDLFAAAQESIEQEELEHKENAYVDETEEENENVAAALVAEESKEESHKKPELTNEFLDELLGLDFGDKEIKSVNKTVDNVALVAEENVEASELDNFDVVDKIDAAIDEEIALKAKEAAEAVEESAEAETEIEDVVEEVQEKAIVEENIEDTLESVAEENEETTAAQEETIEESAEDQVEEILETENVENAEEATVTEAEENAEESSENQVEELLETEIEETVEESPETEIEENVDESSENQAEETLEAENEENVDESSDNQAEELLETEAEENTVASAETSESAKEIDAVPAKTEFTYKNPSTKERRSKRNFSFDILSMSNEEPVTEKKEEKVKKESDNDGFSLPGGGRSVFSRRSRSSSSNQNSSRRNRINLAELSDSTESREENITEIKDKSEEKTEEVKAFDSEVTNIETNAAEEVSKESFAEEAKESIAEETKESIAEETKESIAEETKESIAEETKESLPEEIIETSDNENSVEESEVKEETEEKTEESSEESAAKSEESLESKEEPEEKASKKGKSSFGRTTNFKADTESKVERLVTREQAIGDDLDSEKVEFSRVEKFKTDDLADATNPHERFIKKDESIKDGPKGTFRVTSSFNSADFPEEKRVERPSYWDKELIYKAKEEAKQKELEEAAKAKEKAEAEAKAKAEEEAEENEEANQNVSGEVLEDISKEETKTDTLTDEKAEEVSFEDTAEETVEDTIEEEQTVENSVEEISEESEEVTFEETAEETTEDTIDEESDENSKEEVSEESEEVSFEETVAEETANEESLEENAEEPSFEETAEETFEEEQTEENSNEEVSEESEEVSFEETVAEETSIEEVSEETSYEETNEEIVEESSFEETADEAIEDAAEDLEETSFEETPVETTEETAEETSFEETAAESEFEKAAEEMNEEEIDDLSVIDEQAASKSIVKSWQNRYNGVGTSYIHEKKDDDRVVRSGSISNDLYGRNFALSSVGKKGIMDHELDDLDGGKEYVTKSSSKGTIIKSESYSEPEKQRPEKDLSAFKIIKESDTRFGNSEKKEEKAEASVEPVNPATEKPVDTPVSVKPEVTPAPAPVKPADSIFPSPAKPVGEKRNDFLKKDIDTSIVFRNARVIKTTKITRNIDEEPQFKKEEKKEKVYSDKQKVIAVIRNGEIIPVNEDKKEEIPAEPVAAKKPAKAENTKASRKKKKRGKNKKDAEDSSEEMMQAPISVMLDAKEAASMTEPLENPVARTRNFKI